MAVVAAERPALSIIIPALNEAENLPDTLACLQPMRARGQEVIVVDGGSRDTSIETARHVADQVIGSARGRARQMNRGAQFARGEILWFLHADTRVPEHADGAILSAVASTGRCWGRFDVQVADASLLLAWVTRLMNLRSRLTGIATGDQGMFMTRAAFEQMGGFEEIPLMEDIAASRCLRRQSPPAALHDTLLTSARRWRRHGVIRTIVTMWALRLAYFLGVPAQRLARYYPVHS